MPVSYSKFIHHGLRSSRGAAFRLCAVAALVVYVIAATGVPLPVPGEKPSAGGERFPCEQSACGCMTAEQCWTKCCCRSLAGNLAWARDQGVRPPEFALTFARAQGLDTSHWDGPQKPTEKRILIAKAEVESPHGCCCCRADQSCPRPERSDNRRRDASDSRLVVVEALACQGIAQAWLALGIATPPPIAVRCAPLERTNQGIDTYSETAVSVARSIDPPPPKRLS